MSRCQLCGRTGATILSPVHRQERCFDCAKLGADEVPPEAERGRAFEIAHQLLDLLARRLPVTLREAQAKQKTFPNETKRVAQARLSGYEQGLHQALREAGRILMAMENTEVR